MYISNIPNPGRAATHRGSEDTADEERRVESQTTSDQIRRHSPEAGANAQTDEQRTGRETHMQLGNTKLRRERGQR
jgi:hypothetical protein